MGIHRRTPARQRNARIRGILALLTPVAAALGMLAAAAAQKADISELRPQNIQVAARPFALDPSNPNRREFGRLEWRGGLILSSRSTFFGGYSGLSLSPDGKSFLAVSDAGSWLSGELNDQDGMLTGLHDTKIGAILQKDGRPLQKRGHRDAEDLVSLDGGNLDGRYLIAFEGFHRLAEYEFKKGELRGPIRRTGLPRQLKTMSANRGLEGVTLLRGGPNAGALMLFAERLLDKNGDHTGAIMRGGKSYPVFLKRHAEFDITSLASLSDGSLLVLERSFLPASLKLDIGVRLIPAKDIKPGARLEGEVIFEANQSLTIDNFEAIGVSEAKDGEVLITLMSDDNFNFFQKTLLIQFALKAK
jgi:hypothetical protein